MSFEQKQWTCQSTHELILQDFFAFDGNQMMLYDSSVAAMLGEMQRQVNTGHPFESKLHID